MAVPSGGPYYIVLAGRGTAQTETLYYGSKPNVQNTYASNDTLGPYKTLASALSQLKSLTVSGQVTVVQTSNNAVLGNVTVATGNTGSGAAVPGSSEPSNPAQAVEDEGGNVAPALANPLDWLEDIAKFFDWLEVNAENWAIRAGEFVAGGIILYMGFRVAFPEAHAAATGAVKKAATAAVLF